MRNDAWEDIDELGFCIKNRPSLPSPKQRLETYEVPGRDGSLTVKHGYSDIEITVELNALSNTLKRDLRTIKNKLSKAERIQFSDDRHYYYEVKNVEFGDIENEIDVYGSFEVTFLCDPFCYEDTWPLIESSKQMTTINIDSTVAFPLINVYYNRPTGTTTVQPALDMTFYHKSETLNIVVPADRFGQGIVVDFKKRTITNSNGGNAVLNRLVGDFMSVGEGMLNINVNEGYSIEYDLRKGWL